MQRVSYLRAWWKHLVLIISVGQWSTTRESGLSFENLAAVVRDASIENSLPSLSKATLNFAKVLFSWVRVWRHLVDAFIACERRLPLVIVPGQALSRNGCGMPLRIAAAFHRKSGGVTSSLDVALTLIYVAEVKA